MSKLSNIHGFLQKLHHVYKLNTKSNIKLVSSSSPTFAEKGPYVRNSKCIQNFVSLYFMYINWIFFCIENICKKTK